MPWNDQTGGGDKGGPGPWGSGPRRPWGAPPRPQPPNQSPDLEELVRRFRQRLGGGSGGGGPGRGGSSGGRLTGSSWKWIVPGLVVAWLLTGVYIVDAGENAVITTLGSHSRTVGPGLHWNAPAPIESRRIENVTGQRTAEIGFAMQGGQMTDNPEESLMITGDRNIVDIHFRVVYDISNIRDFVFNVRDPEQAVRAVAESAMREVIGRRELEPIITTDRAAVELAAIELMQQVLDEYEVGVHVSQVELLSAAAPPAVIEAFNDVVNAGQDAEGARNNAQREAATITNQAQAYRERVVREATGEAERFNSVYAEYRASPRVTRDRLYLETMERVFDNANTVIVDNRGGGVTYLPLEGMIRRNAPAAAAAAPRTNQGGN